MSAEGKREGQELSRRIREELERMRDSEARVEEALETIRQARRRVEVIARDLSREEERVRMLVREELAAAGYERPVEAAAEAPSSPPRVWRSEPAAGWSAWREAPARGSRGGEESVPSVAPERPAAAIALDTPTAVPSESVRVMPWRDRRWQLAGAAVVAVATVAIVGWFAIRGLSQDPPTGPAVATELAPAPVVAPPEEEAAPVAEVPTNVLTELPTDPAARVVLYDTLWTARSNLFDTLLATIDQESSERTVKRAVAAWRAGSVDAQEADLIHSAFVQHVLKRDIDPQVEIDGQVLRNPCRGRSCTALLNVWETQRDKYALPPVPADAPTNTDELRQVEVALVIGWMRDVSNPPSD